MIAARKERVLVVDDEPQVLIALDDLLSDEFVVMKARDGAEALRVIAMEPEEIAVVVTDQRMPIVSGDELLSRLDPECDARRIMLTGFADLTAVVRAVNQGRIFAYVTKPWKPEELLGKVIHAAAEYRFSRAIANERRLFMELMDRVPDGVFFKDEGLRFSRVNRAFAEMMGQTAPEHLLGKSLRDLALPVMDAAKAEEEELELLRTGSSKADAVESRTVNGAQRWYSTTTTRVRNEDGEIGIAGVVRDVTDRVAAAEALKKSEAQLREQTQVLHSILESMSEGVIVADGQLGVLLFNGPARDILGETQDLASMQEWTTRFGLLHPENKRQLPVEMDPLVRAIMGKATPTMEAWVKNDRVPDARIAMAGVPLVDLSGNCVGGVVTLRDVTAQRRMEERLRLSQKMDAIGALAGGVAHDFNNLLSVIMSYGRLVRNSLGEEDPRREDLTELLGAAERAAALTQQLLAVGGRNDGKPRLTRVNEVVSNVQRMLSRVLPGHVHLETHLDESGPVAFIDPGQIEQVLLNLVVNARDALPHGGEIRIESRVVTAAEAPSAGAATSRPPKRSDTVELTVEDNGSGMNAETVSRIFEPFYTTKEAGRGTGLGLSTVFALVKQASGTIDVESEVGKGTRFIIRLEARAGDMHRSEPPPSRSLPPPSSARILVVEDDVSLRRVAARILRGSGYTVLEAKGPDEARRLCQDDGEAIDLILMDVHMPGTSGPELARELLQTQAHSGCVFMSGMSEGQLVEQNLLSAGDTYLEKPFQPDALLHLVAQRLTA